MFKVRCKEDISEVFAVYDVCRFRAQNKQGYDIRFLIYDGCFKYVDTNMGKRQHLIVARGGNIKKER